MRDNHDGLIELIEVAKSDNIYSCVVRLEISEASQKIRFGIESIDYVNLLRIIQFRPFEDTGVAPYRYFFSLSYQKKEDNVAMTSIWVEQLRMHKIFQFEVTQKLIANLLWFDSLVNNELIKDLIV